MLDPEQRAKLVKRMRERAARQPKLTAKERQELRRRATNLERAERIPDVSVEALRRAAFEAGERVRAIFGGRK